MDEDQITHEQLLVILGQIMHDLNISIKALKKSVDALTEELRN